MQQKIEKLKTMIAEGDKTGYNDSDNQWKRDEKLQQKLRYLKFFEAYSVGKSPKYWKCDSCREVEETRAAVAASRCGVVCGTIPPPISSNPPAAVIPDTAFVTDMRGE